MAKLSEQKISKLIEGWLHTPEETPTSGAKYRIYYIKEVGKALLRHGQKGVKTLMGVYKDPVIVLITFTKFKEYCNIWVSLGLIILNSETFNLNEDNIKEKMKELEID